MSATLDPNPEEFVGAMTLEEKVDVLIEALTEVREMMAYIPEISEKMAELCDEVQEIREKLSELGVDTDGFQFES